MLIHRDVIRTKLTMFGVLRWFESDMGITTAWCLGLGHKSMAHFAWFYFILPCYRLITISVLLPSFALFAGDGHFPSPCMASFEFLIFGLSCTSMKQSGHFFPSSTKLILWVLYSAAHAFLLTSSACDIFAMGISLSSTPPLVVPHDICNNPRRGPHLHGNVKSLAWFPDDMLAPRHLTQHTLNTPCCRHSRMSPVYELFHPVLWSSSVCLVSLVVLWRIPFYSVSEAIDFLSFAENVLDLCLVGNVICDKLCS